MRAEQFETPRPLRLEVKVAAGDIHVMTVDGEQSAVSLEGPDKLVDATRIEQAGDRLLIDQRRTSGIGWFGHWNQPLRVQCRVPHGSSIRIMTASGDATLDGAFHEVEMNSASGELRVTGEIDGDTQVKTVSGDVRLPGVGGDLSVRSVSADVVADSVNGSALVHSVSGDLRLGSLREGKVNVQSVSGDVALGIASGTTIDIDANSASGEMTSEVALSDAPVEDGGPSLVIRGNTVSGDFSVFRAA